MKRQRTTSMKLILASVLSVSLGGALDAATIDFSDVPLSPESYFSGPTANAVEVSGPFGPELDGTIASGGALFVNRVDETFGSWSGFAVSNTSDTTTPGVDNQYSANKGAGVGGGNYGVAFGYLDQVANQIQPFNFNPNDVSQLVQLPYFQLPAGYAIQGMEVTNTTYATQSMLHGDSFAKKFGGSSGNDQDYFKLTAYGTKVGAGNTVEVIPASVDFYLADYRSANNGLDYIVNNWTQVDLSPLGSATTLYFNVSSSDAGQFGLNTPGYFAVDNIQLVAVPEPSSFVALCGAAVWGLVFVRRRQRALRESIRQTCVCAWLLPL